MNRADEQIGSADYVPLGVSALRRPILVDEVFACA